MSRNDRDQRGGHWPARHPQTYGYDCGCCASIPRADRDPTNRTKRERTAQHYEQRAEGH